MKTKVTKIGAAKSQLLEAINLFFEERDPVSIHTLVGASLEILNDHFDDKGEVWDLNLALHPDSIYIKDEYRKEWADSLNKAKNFFKHADRDLKKGIDDIEFDPDVNEFFILETIRRLQLVQKDAFIFEPEFKVFSAWLMRKRPHMVKAEHRETVEQVSAIDIGNFADFKKMIDVMKNFPHLFLGKAAA